MERPDEERQSELNPHRTDDRERATELIAARLRERRVALTGDENSEEVVNMMTAVERFEAAVAALGGDSMTNAPDSHDPDNEAFVLPPRRDGEPAGAYADRVTRAAERLRSRAD